MSSSVFPEIDLPVFPHSDEFYDNARAETEKLAEKEARQKKGIWRIKPVDPITFIEDYIGTKTLSKPQKDVLRGIFGNSPSKYFFAVEQAILRIGQGGGKNFTVSRMVTYAIYLWSCLEDPHAYFGLAHTEPFDILNYSQVSEQQAKNVFFKSLAAIMKITRDPISGNNWFTEHINFRIKDFGTGDIKERELSIPNHNPQYGGIRVFCLDTTAKSVEGYTIWMSIMDEPSRANTKIKYETAKHQYETAHTNQETRFTNPHNRLTIVFAYPEQEVHDLLMHLFKQYCKHPMENSIEIVDNVLTAWFATYEFNAKEKVAKRAAYKRSFKRDPLDANRRWRAIVPPNIYGFFMPHFEKIEDCANPKLFLPVKTKETSTIRRETVKGVEQDVTYSALELLSVKGDTRERFWGGDFAVNHDRLIIVGGYAERLSRPIDEFEYSYRTPEGEEVYDEKTIDCRPVIDIILIWEPLKHGWPVDYQNVEDILLDLLKRHFPRSRALHFDQWNTESIRQKVIDIGIRNCEVLSFSNPMQLLYGRMVRHLVWNNAMEYPKNKILITEMTQLILEGNHKLDHPDTGSKDIWDAVSICVNLIMERGYKGAGLSIADNEGEDDSQAELDQMMVIFDKAFMNFVATNNRKPKDNTEMRSWLKRTMRVDWSEAEVELMYQSWTAWTHTLNARMARLGLKTTGKVTPQRNIGARDETVAEDMGQLSTIERDLMEMEKKGGNIIL